MEFSTGTIAFNIGDKVLFVPTRCEGVVTDITSYLHILFDSGSKAILTVEDVRNYVKLVKKPFKTGIYVNSAQGLFHYAQGDPGTWRYLGLLPYPCGSASTLRFEEIVDNKSLRRVELSTRCY